MMLDGMGISDPGMSTLCPPAVLKYISYSRYVRVGSRAVKPESAPVDVLSNVSFIVPPSVSMDTAKYPVVK